MENYEIATQKQNNDLIQSNILVIDEVEEYTKQDYDLFNEKDFDKYIKDVERSVRTSYEYREFINYLRTYMDMNKCSFFENVNNIDTFKIKIHLHHSPFNLYEIALTVFNKRMFYHESVEVELVALETMYIHYFLMVGLIPLAETVHQLVHEQLVFIPLDKVMGNYQEFIDNYKQFIPEESMEKFEYVRQQTEIYNEAANLEIFKEKPLLIQIPHEDGSGTYELPAFNKLMDLMVNRIEDIKSEQSRRIEVSPFNYDNNITEEEKLISPFVYCEDEVDYIIDQNGRTLIRPIYYE